MKSYRELQLPLYISSQGIQTRKDEADGVIIWTFFPVVLSQKTPPKSIIYLTKEYKILLLSSDAPYELYVMGKDY